MKKVLIGLCAMLFAVSAEANNFTQKEELQRAQFEDARYGQKHTAGIMLRKGRRLYVVIPSCEIRGNARILLVRKLELNEPVRIKTKSGTRMCTIEAIAEVSMG